MHLAVLDMHWRMDGTYQPSDGLTLTTVNLLGVAKDLRGQGVGQRRQHR